MPKTIEIQSITRLRVGAACNLQINLGRRHRALHLPVDCNCDFCMSTTNTTFVEYEHHFIMQYPFPVKNRVFQWLFIFDTHRDIIENVEIYIHMTFDIHCKYVIKDTTINSDINLRLNPVSEGF